MTPEREHTIASVADRYGVDKRTVQSWLKRYKGQHQTDIGEMFNGTRMLSLEEVETLAQYRKPKTPKLTPEPEPVQVVQIVEEPEIATTTVVPYEARGFNVALALQQLDGALGGKLDNVEQVVEGVEFICDTVATALESKVYQQEQELEQTEEQLNRVKAAKKIFRRRTVVASAESKQAAREQSSTTDAIKEVADEIFNLGKEPQQ